MTLLQFAPRLARARYAYIAGKKLHTDKKIIQTQYYNMNRDDIQVAHTRVIYAYKYYIILYTVYK